MKVLRCVSVTGCLLGLLLLTSCTPSKYVSQVIPISTMVVKPENNGQKQDLESIRKMIDLEKDWVVGIDYSNIRFTQFPLLRNLLTQETNEISTLNLSGNFSSSVGNTFTEYYPIYRSFINVLSAPKNNIRVLNLSSNFLDSRSVYDLSKQLVNNNNKVVELDLQNNMIGNRGVSALIQALKNPHCKLRLINLSYNTFDNPTRERLIQVVALLEQYGRDVKIYF
jgi:hypothetical protein